MSAVAVNNVNNAAHVYYYLSRAQIYFVFFVKESSNVSNKFYEFI